ncbi:helix-turn-helix domain-containing protein [Mesorhizobium sp. BR-1-1-8]|uniref:helix-turn-helix domain-containing protein n=1 Tax=Mesorhizobium sp. BR-1-1-8 TaxID=2876659 RepID=UPI001CCBB79C|nr:helix-turn-helix domain-containing protein [Mesorhizobium sp. BR-1-1-8]
MSAITNFGTILRELRKLRELTQEDLALRTDRSVDAVSQWERGVYWPNFETLVRLGKALDVPVRVFFQEGNLTQAEERAMLEIQAGVILSGLTDSDLRVAIEQLKALAKRTQSAS